MSKDNPKSNPADEKKDTPGNDNASVEDDVHHDEKRENSFDAETAKKMGSPEESGRD